MVSPTYVPDLVDASLDLLIDGEAGIWHLANRGSVTWAELGREAAALAGLDPSLVLGIRTEELRLVADDRSSARSPASAGRSCPHWKTPSTDMWKSLDGTGW